MSGTRGKGWHSGMEGGDEKRGKGREGTKRGRFGRGGDSIHMTSMFTNSLLKWVL